MQTNRLLALLSITVLGSACMVGSGDAPAQGDTEPNADDLPPQQSEAALGNNARTAFNYFVAKGLTQTESAAIVGNLMQESSVSPTAVEYGGGPGRGIAQWGIGARWNSGRTDSVSAFATARGANRWNLSTQLDFIWFELSNYPDYGLDSLRRASSLTAAVTVFQNKFEACGSCSQSLRIQYAQQALRDYGGSSSTGTGSGGGSGSGGTSDPGGGDPTGDVPTMTCYSGTLGMDVPENTCVESKFDGLWYQCSYGGWIDRWSDPDPCASEHPL
jgi:hypothetical protein